MPILHFNEPRPKLNPPIDCWREDMPESYEPQLVPPQLRWLAVQNDIYLEVPRYSTEVIWWGMLLWAILMFIIDIGMIIFSLALQEKSGSYVFLIIGLVSTVIFSSLVFLGLKMYFVVPRNQPIRLNRKRQKLYVYTYNRSRLPWLNWSATIKTYNWADVYGEISFSPTPGDRGYRLYGAICTPGTYNVVERFLLAKEWEEREQLNQIWSYLCIYMNNENDLPAPRNPGRPDFWRPRSADKWAADMELESTTVPHAAIKQ